MKPLARNLAPVLGVVALACGWLWLQWPQIALQPGDEPLYILDGQRLLDGAALYRDVFLAHPPLRAWQTAAVLAMGAPLGWAKVFSPLATLTAALLTWHFLRRAADDRTALLAAALLLCANVVLQHGAQFVGVEQALSAAVLATVLALAHRWLLAGLCLGLASQWALHVGLLALPMLFWAWQDRALRPFVLGLTLGLLPLAFELVWFGAPMRDQVLVYHVRKVSQMAVTRTPARIWPFVLAHLPLLLLALVGVWRGPVLARRLGFAGLAALGLLLLWPRLQTYYFLLPIPWLAMAAALTWHGLPAVWLRRALLLGLALAAVPSARDALDRRARGLLVQPEMTRLAAQVQTLAAGSPIWGDGALVPLLALRTGLPVALGDTDLNAQRFLSGATAPDAHLTAVLAQKPLIVLVPRHGIDQVPAFHERLLRDCDVVGQFDAPAANFAGLLLRPR